jgi:hypothetical protein
VVLPGVRPVVFLVSDSASLARTQGGCNGSAIAPTEDAASGVEAPRGTDWAYAREYY